MSRDVLIVGGGVAGLSAGIFTARAGLETVVVTAGESILNRNANLENFLGFPAGVDARRLLQSAREQALAAGCEFQAGRVVDVDPLSQSDVDADPEFGAATGFDVLVSPATDEDARRVDGIDPEPPQDEPWRVHADRVVAASWSDVSYLSDLDVTTLDRGSKTYLAVDGEGRTDVDGLYAAGRIAGQYHQAVVAAGHGATVGISVVHDSETPFYHDWVTPEGYFTGRDRDVPPGCEEIDDAERRERDREGREGLRDRLAEPLDETPTMHPSVDEE